MKLSVSKSWKVLVFGLLTVIGPDAARGTDVSQQHATLAAQLGLPPYELSTDWIGFQGVFGIGLQVNVGGSLGGTLAGVTMEGAGLLHYSQYPGSGTVNFMSSAGHATMDVGFETWARYRITFFGRTVESDLPLLPGIANTDLRFSDDKAFDSYLLGRSVTLRDTSDLIPIVGVALGLSSIGLDGFGDITFSIGISPTLECNLTGTGLQTSAGTIYSAEAALNVNVNAQSVTMSDITQTTHCNFRFGISPGGTIEVSIIGLYDNTFPFPSGLNFTFPVASTDIVTSPSRSITFNLQSPPPTAITPVITSVSPAALPGLALLQTQRITIVGSGFTESSTLTFNDGTTTYPSRSPVFISPYELKYDIAVGTQPARWTVKVLNSTAESSAYPFYVVASGDTTAPGAPIGLAGLSSWANNNQFTLDWTNPNDPSGIAKVWWKIGSAPTAPSDGLSYRLPAYKPLPVSLSLSEGAQTIYVWLEDGAGNKSHNNRASATLRLDVTRPTVGITSPTPNLSYALSQGSIALSGEYADNLSGVISVTWVNSRGGSGNASLTGNPLNGTWSTAAITIYSGNNTITVTATDTAGNKASAVIFVNRNDTSDSGTVSVTITPQGAIDAGAQWRVNGGPWRNSGYVEQNVPTGPRFVEFMSIPGSYLTPVGFSVNVTAGQNILESRIYTFVFVPAPPNTPSNPSPAHGAVDVGRAQPRFSWSGAAPGGDLQYLFCIDINNPTNPDPAPITGWGSLANNSFQFPGTTFTLPATTTFNWRVKARANGITVDGPLWRFTTEYAVADLAVKNLALDGNVEPGANVTLSVTVTNQGNFVAPLGYLFFYLSRTPGGKEIRLNLPVSLVVWPLQPGQSTNITFSAKLDGLPAGQSFIDAWVDTTAYGATGESNFENNLTSIQLNYIDGKNPQVTYAALSTTFVKPGVANSIVYVATDDVGVKTMDFYYSTDDGVTWVPIQEGYVPTTPPFAGAVFNWTVPANLTVGANLKVRVVARDASGNWGESIAGPYLIRDGTAPVVRVVFPNGGEALPAGSVQQFRWSISAPNGVQYASLSLYYDNNNVITAQGITDYTTGTYSWTLPANVTTTVAKVRITVRDRNGNTSEDWSDGPFSIVDNSQPPPAPWNAAVAVTSAATGDPAGSPRIVADSTGTLHLIYGLSHNATNHTISFRYRKRIGTAWTSPSVVSFDVTSLDNQSGSSYVIGNWRFAVDSNNHPQLVWATSFSFWSEQSKNDIFYTSFDGANWSPPQNLSSTVRSPLLADSITWSRKADIPFASSTSAAAAVGGKLYFIYYEQIYQYDPVANSWTRKADAPSVAVDDGGATVVNNLIYAAGNSTDGNIRIYNPSANSWSTGAAMPSPQQGVRLVAAANGMVYAMGGDTGPFSGGTKARMYNPGANSWTTMTDMPTARSHPAVAAVGTKVYVIGGYQSQQSMDIYDTVGNTWTTKAYPFAANIPPSFGGFAAVANNKIYFVPGGLYGGLDPGAFPSYGVWEYDPATGGWTRMLPTQFQHGWACGAAIGSKLYVLGGYDGFNNVSSMEEGALSTDFAGTRSFAPQVAVDAANMVHVLWQDGTYLQPDGSTVFSFSFAGTNNVYEAVKSGAGWSSPAQLTSGGVNLHAVVADQSGNLHLSYQANNNDIAYSQRSGGSWSAPILAGLGLYAYGLDMAVDSTSKVHLLYSGNDPQTSLINLNYITLSGTSWSPSERVSSIQYGVSPRLCLDSLNRPHAIWVGSQVDPQVLYSTRSGGGWFAPIQLNRASEPPAYGSVDAALRLGSNELNVVWLGSNPGNPNVLLNYANVGSATDIYPPTVAVNAPIAGDILSIGNQATVTWAATDNIGVTTVSIHYSTNNGSSWTLIATNQANSGTFAWFVPNLGTNVGQVRVTARDAAGNSGVGFSGTFTTTDLTPPTITITAPTNGATLIGGVTNSVVWTATDNAAVARIDLEYSLNNGASWSDMATNLTNGGSYPWLTPNSATTVLLIRATARDTAGLSASATTQPITIVRANTPPLAPNSPFPLNGSTFVLTVSPQFSWSSSDLDGDPLTYQIRFGTNTTPPIVSSGSASSFTPGLLRPQRTYYWQVIASDGKATTTGPLWSFTTEAGALPATVLADPNRTTNGGFQFRLSGLFGESYSVQASTNLTVWQTLTNIINTNANTLFLDTAATNFPRRFYRAVMP